MNINKELFVAMTMTMAGCFHSGETVTSDPYCPDGYKLNSDGTTCSQQVDIPKSCTDGCVRAKTCLPDMDVNFCSTVCVDGYNNAQTDGCGGWTSLLIMCISNPTRAVLCDPGDESIQQVDATGCDWLNTLAQEACVGE